MVEGSSQAGSPRKPIISILRNVPAGASGTLLNFFFFPAIAEYSVKFLSIFCWIIKFRSLNFSKFTRNRQFVSFILDGVILDLENFNFFTVNDAIFNSIIYSLVQCNYHINNDNEG